MITHDKRKIVNDTNCHPCLTRVKMCGFSFSGWVWALALWQVRCDFAKVNTNSLHWANRTTPLVSSLWSLKKWILLTPTNIGKAKAMRWTWGKCLGGLLRASALQCRWYYWPMHHNTYQKPITRHIEHWRSMIINVDLPRCQAPRADQWQSKLSTDWW